MRQLGSFFESKQAEALSRHLRAVGIESKLGNVEKEGEVEIWILDEDLIERAKGELQSYLSNPSDKKFSEQPAVSLEDEREATQRQAYLQKFQRRAQVIDVRTDRAMREMSERKTGNVTIGVIVICVIIYLLVSPDLAKILPFQRGDAILSLVFYGNPGESPFESILNGELWRLITPAFVHTQFLHLLFNLFLFLQLGKMTEAISGSLFMVFFVVLSGIFSNTLQYLAKGPLFLGLSGVGYALIGLVWMRSRFDSDGKYYISKESILSVFVFFFMCLTGILGPVANTAHGAGLFLGMLVGLISAKKFFYILNPFKIRREDYKVTFAFLLLLPLAVIVDRF